MLTTTATSTTTTRVTLMEFRPIRLINSVSPLIEMVLYHQQMSYYYTLVGYVH
jgi:hypothetical protein